MSALNHLADDIQLTSNSVLIPWVTLREVSVEVEIVSSPHSTPLDPPLFPGALFNPC
jgi:hypothetical protein